MFAVYLGSILTTVLWVNRLAITASESSGFVFGVAVWLWFTVLFANFAEAIAEGMARPRRHRFEEEPNDGQRPARLPNARRDRLSRGSAGHGS